MLARTLHLPPRPPRGRRPRLLRAVAAACALVATSACGGGDSTGPRDANGTYRITRAEGQTLPVTAEVDGAAVTLTGGTMTLDGDRFTATFDLRTDGQSTPLQDNGSVARSGGGLTFSSARFGDEFRGTLSDNNRTLTLGYDFIGDGSSLSLRYER